MAHTGRNFLFLYNRYVEDVEVEACRRKDAKDLVAQTGRRERRLPVTICALVIDMTNSGVGASGVSSYNKVIVA